MSSISDFYFPMQKGVFPDLMATSGDYLRVWRVGDSETRLECLLNNVSNMFKVLFLFLFFLASTGAAIQHLKVKGMSKGLGQSLGLK